MSEIETQVREHLRTEGITFPKEVIQEFYGQLLKVSGFGLGGLMSAVAKKAGVRGGKLMQKIIPDAGGRDTAVEVARAFFGEAGFGELEVRKSDDSHITFFIPGGSTFAGSADSVSKKPICNPIASALGGFLEVNIGGKVSIKETECAAKGDGGCTFEAELK